MRKQYIIILTVICGLMAALLLASCAQSSSSDSSADSTESTASEAVDTSEDAAAEADNDGYTGLPTLQPADHAGRTADMCPTCHVEGVDGAAAIPEDHFVNGELDSNRLQCITCHVLEPAA